MVPRNRCIRTVYILYICPTFGVIVVWANIYCPNQLPGIPDPFETKSSVKRAPKAVFVSSLVKTEACATWPPKFKSFSFKKECRYHGLHLDLQIVTFHRLRVVSLPRWGRQQDYLLWRPPPLTALNLLDRPRGTASSVRNYLAVPNLRPPRRGVVQSADNDDGAVKTCCDHT